MASSDPDGFGADFRLTLLTDDPDLAEAADVAGVDRIGIDIERLGKSDRQRPALEARLSGHSLADLRRLVGRVKHAKLFCRLDPPHPGGTDQIEQALNAGADSLMLPFFHETGQAAAFVEAVAGRAETILLVETASAAWRIDALAALEGVDEIMVGLNDLSWDCGLDSPFESMTSPLMEGISAAVNARGKRFSMGGLARWTDDGLPTPPDLIYAQYPRLAARGAWLARSFLKGLDGPALEAEVGQLRERLDHWAAQPPTALEYARQELVRAMRPA